MFNKVKEGFKKDGHIIDPKQIKERKFQEESRKKLIEWQVENKTIIQPVLQPTVDTLKATFMFVQANDEQLKALKELTK